MMSKTEATEYPDDGIAGKLAKNAPSYIGSLLYMQGALGARWRIRWARWAGAYPLGERRTIEYYIAPFRTSTVRLHMDKCWW